MMPGSCSQRKKLGNARTTRGLIRRRAICFRRRRAKRRFCSCELLLLPRAFALVASPYPLTCLRLLGLFLNLRSNFSLLDLWKVRRATAKCLAALIVSRLEMLSKLYDEACPKLIDRFKEREENVKMDVFNTFIELLRQTGNVTKGQTDANETSHRWLLKQEVSKIVKSINRQLREKSIKTKVVALSILKELVVVLPDCLADHIGSLIPGIEKALNDKSYTSNLKIEALIFTILVLSSQSPDVFYPYIKALSAPVLSAVGERYYKVTAEALRVCGELILVVRPSIEGSGFDFRPYVHPIYNGIMSRIINQDRDHEVKECAICCIALIVSIFGDHLNEELPACLPIGSSAYEVIIVELSELISDSDIHMTALALELCCTLMSDKRSSPSAGLAVRNKVLPQALTLIKSSLLQEQVLLALQNFFAALVYSANTISANEIDESCDERVPEPLIPSLNEEPYAPLLLERVSLGGVTTCPRQAFTTVRWHCQTSIVFNSSMCGCSVPCCWGSEVFVHSENAGRHFQG
ncbi:hypothetical protein S245_017714 [Arachis hypogaea]